MRYGKRPSLRHAHDAVLTGLRLPEGSHRGGSSMSPKHACIVLRSAISRAIDDARQKCPGPEGRPTIHLADWRIAPSWRVRPGRSAGCGNRMKSDVSVARGCPTMGTSVARTSPTDEVGQFERMLVATGQAPTHSGEQGRPTTSSSGIITAPRATVYAHDRVPTCLPRLEDGLLPGRATG